MFSSVILKAAKENPYLCRCDQAETSFHRSILSGSLRVSCAEVCAHDCALSRKGIRDDSDAVSLSEQRLQMLQNTLYPGQAQLQSDRYEDQDI